MQRTAINTAHYEVPIYLKYLSRSLSYENNNCNIIILNHPMASVATVSYCIPCVQIHKIYVCASHF